MSQAASSLASFAGASGEREIVLMREFDAPREMVFEAWADPAQLVQWFGPMGFTVTIEKMDLREGGEWVQVMHGPDGANYPGRSVFTRVVRPEVIAFTMGGGREGANDVLFHSTVTFEEIGANKTRLTLRHEYASTEARDRNERDYGAIEGGRQTLERLAALLAKRKVAA
jgi:uncharacterized protein YndB with AHSA1/START domain